MIFSFSLSYLLRPPLLCVWITTPNELSIYRSKSQLLLSGESSLRKFDVEVKILYIFNLQCLAYNRKQAERQKDFKEN